MYLHTIEVENYSIHRASVLHLHPLTVLVGPCGGGKSAFFDAITNFSMVARGRIGEAFGYWPFSFEARRFHGAAKDERIGFRVEMSPSKAAASRYAYRIDYEQVPFADDDLGEPRYRIVNEQLEQLDGDRAVHFRRSPRRFHSSIAAAEPFLTQDRSVFAAIRRAVADNAGAAVDPTLAGLARDISRFAKYRLNPYVLRQPGVLPDADPGAPKEAGIPWLGYEGDNLASLLYFLQESKSDRLEQIKAAIRKVLPSFDNFVFNAVGAGRIGFSIRYADKRHIVPAANLSDGTLILIGLLGLVHTPNRPPVLCLEEPENGLNPPAIRAIYSALRDAATTSEQTGSQIIFSSHSPLVVTEAWNGSDREFLYQLQTDTDGAAVIVPMKDLLADYQLGKNRDGRDRLSYGHACEILAGNR